MTAGEFIAMWVFYGSVLGAAVHVIAWIQLRPLVWVKKSIFGEADI